LAWGICALPPGAEGRAFSCCARLVTPQCFGQVQQLSKVEVEDLLRKGAYGALMDEEDEGSKFCEEDIDQILQRRTQTITIQSEGKGSTFAKVCCAPAGGEGHFPQGAEGHTGSALGSSGGLASCLCVEMCLHGGQALLPVPLRPGARPRWGSAAAWFPGSLVVSGALRRGSPAQVGDGRLPTRVQLASFHLEAGSGW